MGKGTSVHTVAQVLTFARGVASGSGTVGANTWEGARSRLVSLDSRESHVTFARAHLVGAFLARGVSGKDVAQHLGVGASQVSNYRNTLAAWAQVGASDETVMRKVTLASGSVVPFFALFTNAHHGIRDAHKKSDAWANMVASIPADADDSERVDAVVAYVNGYIRPVKEPDTIVDMLAKVARKADAGVELSADERAAVAQILADIAHATGVAPRTSALATA